jgi:Flp pilus assembly protein TadD
MAAKPVIKPSIAPAKPARWPLPALALLTVITFLRVLQCGFVSLDDGDYVFNNPHVLQGLTTDGIYWALTGNVMGLWHPLSLLSFMLDVQLFGLHPVAFHLINVLFHTASVMVLYVILHRMTGSVWRSALVAAIFAIHPLRVESVVWISERKDVLATLFGLLTMWAYVRYTEKRNWLWYVSALLFFALSLMAKQSLVLLPFLLLLLDWWPLRRCGSAGNSSASAPAGPRLAAINRSTALLDKLPFVLLAAAGVALMTTHGLSVVSDALADPANPYHVSIALPTLAQRLSNLPVAYVDYAWKTICPSGLAIFYPMPVRWPAWRIAGASAILAAITTLAVSQWRARPWLVVGWLWFLGMLLPVSGVVTIGGYSMADRYSYFPSIGLLIIAAWSLPHVYTARRRAIAGMVAGSVMATLMALTFVQVGYWKDNMSLWGRAVAVTEPNSFAYAGLGKALVIHGDLAEGVAMLRAAVTMRPEDIRIRIELVHPLDQLGRWEEANNEIVDMLAVIPPQLPAIVGDGEYAGLTDTVPKTRREQMLLIAHARQAVDRFNIAVALEEQATVSMTKHTAAIAQYQEAVRLMSGYASAWYNMGNCFFADRDLQGAIAAYRQATQHSPGVAQYHLNLARALGMANQVEEGKNELMRAVELDPSLPARLRQGG